MGVTIVFVGRSVRFTGGREVLSVQACGLTCDEGGAIHT